MIIIYSDGELITYTAGDTFSLNVSATDEFEQGSKLNFQVAENEQAESVINKIFDLTEDGFEITLSKEETEMLPIGNYIYKIVILDLNGKITTRKSGELIVKWGV